MEAEPDDERIFWVRFWRAVCPVCGRKVTYIVDEMVEVLRYELPRCCGKPLDFNPVNPPAD